MGRLVFDQQSAETIFTVDATSAGAIAFFAEHVPTEFEATEHYFKDTSGVDIEPVAQDPEPGDGHDHSHGGADAFLSLCACKAIQKGWELNCGNMAKVNEAVAALG